MRARFCIMVRKNDQLVLRMPLRPGRYLVAPRTSADFQVGASRAIINVTPTDVQWMRAEGKLSLRTHWIDIDGFHWHAQPIDYGVKTTSTLVRELERQAENKTSEAAEAAASDTLLLLRDGHKAFRCSARDEITVGSDSLNDVVVQDTYVSRAHCVLFRRQSRWFVRDTNSKNGTYLNGGEVIEAEIRAPAWLTVGETVFRIEYERPSDDGFEFGLIGRSKAMKDLRSEIDRYASEDVPALVTGETGTGKELIAKALHKRGRRAGMPFEAINCGALAANLVESELFGHMRGAFTGAHEQRTGAFSRAHTGTLFLDEIGELPLDQQAKLLRVLETYEVRPVGSDKVQRVDVRVIAATHRDLAELVQRGLFREDLYHRLAVLRLHAPALRHRREDIPNLCEFLLNRLAPEGTTARLSEEALHALSQRQFAGNVRELRNILSRGVVRSGGRLIRDTDLLLEDESKLPNQIETAEKAVVLRTLEQFSGDVAKTARQLGIARSTIYRKMRAWRTPLGPVSREHLQP